MLSIVENRQAVPRKTQSLYQNFNVITETASYLVFEAEARNSGEIHTIRVLDPTKTLVNDDFDLAETLFMQELLHLQRRCPGSVLIDTLEINTDRQQVACAIHPCGLLSLQLDEIHEFTNLKNPKVIERLLNDVVSDVEFLWRDLQMRNIKAIVNSENIYYLKKNGTFFLGNWAQIFETNASELENRISKSFTPEELKLKSQNLAAEIKALIFAILEMKKVKFNQLITFQSMPDIRDSTYYNEVQAVTAEGFNDLQEPKELAERLQKLVERMFNRDPKNLPNLDEFKIKEDRQIQSPREKSKANPSLSPIIGNKGKKDDKIQVPLDDSEVNTSLSTTIGDQVKGEQQIQSPLEKSKANPSPSTTVDDKLEKDKKIQTPLEELKDNSSSSQIIENISPKLLAWCSNRNNKISIVDLETQKAFANADGAKISDTANFSWTHVKEAPNTNLLVSLHHNWGKSATMEIVDISKKGEAKKIYSLEETFGVVGNGDVTYNVRRSILGAISLGEQITYHLFSIDTSALNVKDIVKINRKSKWHSQYSTKDQNVITGFDFNPTGEVVATIDGYGVCLISDVSTDAYKLHIDFGKEDWQGRCRWSSNAGEPLVYIKDDENELNMMDIEKKTLVLTNPVKLDSSNGH